MIRNSLICKLINVQANMKEKYENKIKYEDENNNVMSRYDHKIETSLEGIEHLSRP